MTTTKIDSAEAIVGEIATESPLFAGEHGSEMECFYCCTENPQSPEDHAPDCLWIRATKVHEANSPGAAIERSIRKLRF
jgi:hypothetical protein